MQLCEDVVITLSNNTDIKERLVNVMGTEVLLTAEERGEQRGEDKLGTLISKLISLGRTDDVSRAASDKNARAVLYAEFGMND